MVLRSTMVLWRVYDGGSLWLRSVCLKTIFLLLQYLALSYLYERYLSSAIVKHLKNTLSYTSMRLQATAGIRHVAWSLYSWSVRFEAVFSQCLILFRPSNKLRSGRLQLRNGCWKPLPTEICFSEYHCGYVLNRISAVEECLPSTNFLISDLLLCRFFLRYPSSLVGKGLSITRPHQGMIFWYMLKINIW